MTLPRRVNLMITCVGGAMAPALLENILKSDLFDYRIIGADGAEGVSPDNRFLDGFYRIPMGEDADYVARVLEIVKQESIDVMLLGSDGEAAAVAAARDKFLTAGAYALVSSHETLKLISDKAHVYARLKENGIAVPEYCVCKTGEEISAALADYGYPRRSVIVKPTRGRGGRGLHFFCGQDNPPSCLGVGAREKRIEQNDLGPDYFATFKKGRYLVMPCLSLPAYDVDVLAENGQTRGLVVRERINPTGIPFEGNIILADRKIDDYCRAVTSALDLDSLHDLDLMSENGIPRLLEVNPRPSGSMTASLAAGFPLIDAAVARIYGQTVTIPNSTRVIEVLPISSGLSVRPVDKSTAP